MFGFGNHIKHVAVFGWKVRVLIHGRQELEELRHNVKGVRAVSKPTIYSTCLSSLMSVWIQRGKNIKARFPASGLVSYAAMDLQVFNVFCVSGYFNPHIAAQMAHVLFVLDRIDKVIVLKQDFVGFGFPPLGQVAIAYRGFPFYLLLTCFFY